MLSAIGLIEVVGLAAALEAADAAVKAANIEILGYELTKGGGMVMVKITGDVGAVKAAIESAAAAASRISKVYATHVIPRPSNGLEKIIFNKDTVGSREAPVPGGSGTPNTPKVPETSRIPEPAGEPEAPQGQDITGEMASPEGQENRAGTKSPPRQENRGETQAPEAPAGQPAEEEQNNAPRQYTLGGGVVIKTPGSPEEPELTLIPEAVREPKTPKGQESPPGEGTFPEVMEERDTGEGLAEVNPAEICNLCGDPACPRKKGEPRIACIHYHKHSKEDE